MAKYRKKPIVVEAVRWNGDNFPEIMELGLSQPFPVQLIDRDLVVPTLEGWMVAQLGDWIIRGVAGEIYPCKADIFAKTYEAVDAAIDAAIDAAVAVK